MVRKAIGKNTKRKAFDVIDRNVDIISLVDDTGDVDMVDSMMEKYQVGNTDLWGAAGVPHPSQPIETVPQPAVPSAKPVASAAQPANPAPAVMFDPATAALKKAKEVAKTPPYEWPVRRTRMSGHMGVLAPVDVAALVDVAAWVNRESVPQTQSQTQSPAITSLPPQWVRQRLPELVSKEKDAVSRCM